MPDKNINQRTLARLLGISQMTVSRAFGARSGVSKKLKTTILSAAKEHGYVMDHFASGLRTKKAKVIALIVPDISDSFFPDIAQIVESYAKKHGFSIVLSHSRESYKLECQEISLLRGFRVGGFIIAPSGNQRQYKVYHNLQELGTPFVFIDRAKEHVDCSYVITDTRKGALHIGRYLLKTGYKKWGYLRGLEGVSSSESHFEGLRASLKEAGLDVNSMSCVIAGFKEQEGYEAVQELMNRAEPDVIIAVNDLVAVGAYRFLKERSIRVPQDIALVGFSDLKFMDILELPLTTVKEDINKIGQKAIETLLQEIDHPKQAKQKIVIEPELIIRNSA